MILPDKTIKTFQDTYFDALSTTFRKEDSKIGTALKNIFGVNAVYISSEQVLITRDNVELEKDFIYKTTINKNEFKLLVKGKLPEKYVVSLKINDQDISFECNKYLVNII